VGGMFYSFCFSIFFSSKVVAFYPAFIHSHLFSLLHLFRTKDETIGEEQTGFYVKEGIQRAEHEWRNGVMMGMRYDKREARGVEGVKSFVIR
jgi:hypothetical protein